MSDTHPNAFLAEADEKRKAAANLIHEANELELKAQQLAAPDDLENASAQPTSEQTESDKKADEPVKKDEKKK